MPPSRGVLADAAGTEGGACGTTVAVAGRRGLDRVRVLRPATSCPQPGSGGTGGTFSAAAATTSPRRSPDRRLARGVVGDSGSCSRPVAKASAAWSTAAPATDETRLGCVAAALTGESGSAGANDADDDDADEVVDAEGRGGGGPRSSLLGLKALRKLAVDLRSLSSPLRIVPVLLVLAAPTLAAPAESVSLADAADAAETDSVRGFGLDLERGRPCDRPRVWLGREPDGARGRASVEEEAEAARSSGAVANTGAGLRGRYAAAE